MQIQDRRESSQIGDEEKTNEMIRKEEKQIVVRVAALMHDLIRSKIRNCPFEFELIMDLGPILLQNYTTTLKLGLIAKEFADFGTIYNFK